MYLAFGVMSRTASIWYPSRFGQRLGTFSTIVCHSSRSIPGCSSWTTKAGKSRIRSVVKRSGKTWRLILRRSRTT